MIGVAQMRMRRHERANLEFNQTELDPTDARARVLGWGCRVGLALTLTLAVMGCNRRTEPYLPPDREPPAPTKPVRIPSLGTFEAQLPGMAGAQGDRGMANSPAGGGSRPAMRGGPANGASAASQGEPIRGTIRLADGITDPGSGVLFITVRNRPGPPLASLKLPVGSFPVEFEIGPQNVMIPTNRFEGELSVSARIDRDGNPMTREAGNLVGEVPEKVLPGTTGLEIVLDGSDG